MNEILIYQSADNAVEIQVAFDHETVWLTQEQITTLFERDQSVISRHIRNVFREKELEEKSNMQKMHIANSDKPVTYYSLDVIISVGYRVKSLRALNSANGPPNASKTTWFKVTRSTRSAWMNSAKWSN